VRRRYGWSLRGQQLFGERTGKREQRENLLAARQEGKMIAPMLITGSVNAICFEKWLSQWLMPNLKENSILIMDNAPIHRKSKIRELAEQKGHIVKFLPKYSPDLNKIEHDFAALKKRREYLPEGTSLDQLIRDYCDAL
jgi:transposase